MFLLTPIFYSLSLISNFPFLSFPLAYQMFHLKKMFLDFLPAIKWEILVLWSSRILCKLSSFAPTSSDEGKILSDSCEKLLSSSLDLSRLLLIFFMGVGLDLCQNYLIIKIRLSPSFLSTWPTLIIYLIFPSRNASPSFIYAENRSLILTMLRLFQLYLLFFSLAMHTSKTTFILCQVNCVSFLLLLTKNEIYYLHRCFSPQKYYQFTISSRIPLWLTLHRFMCERISLHYLWFMTYSS